MYLIFKDYLINLDSCSSIYLEIESDIEYASIKFSFPESYYRLFFNSIPDRKEAFDFFANNGYENYYGGMDEEDNIIYKRGTPNEVYIKWEEYCKNRFESAVKTLSDFYNNLISAIGSKASIIDYSSFLKSGIFDFTELRFDYHKKLSTIINELEYIQNK